MGQLDVVFCSHRRGRWWRKGRRGEQRLSASGRIVNLFHNGQIYHSQSESKRHIQRALYMHHVSSILFLQVTHHGRVPVFSSPRSRSRTVLSVVFSGCSTQVDSVTSTQLFTVSLGIMAIEAWATGFCSCSDAIPASWKPSSDSHEKVLV